VSDRRQPLRIAYVLLDPPGYSETFITSEIRAVEAAGASVELFVARRGGRLDDLRQVTGALLKHPLRMLAQVRALGLSYGLRAVLAGAYAIALTGRIRRFRPDIVHAHFVNLPTAVAVLVAEALDRPATAMAHAADFLLDRNVTALARRLGRLSHLFVISAATATQLASRGIDLSRIPHGIVRAAFDGKVADRPPQRGGAPTRLVTVARLVGKKGIDTGIDAVAALVAAGRDVRYDIVGDGPCRRELQRRVSAAGLSTRVRFHGPVAHDVATAALSNADIALLPCREDVNGDLDGIPVFLMEAASRGVPVVTTAVSGIPELVAPTGGWLVPPDDAATLARVLDQAIGDPAECRRRSQALTERLRAEFSPTLQAERLLDTWHRLASRNAGAAASTTTGAGHPWT
jgi:glycosyltransferase involved in cell wall biosynthesis